MGYAMLQLLKVHHLISMNSQSGPTNIEITKRYRLHKSITYRILINGAVQYRKTVLENTFLLNFEKYFYFTFGNYL